MMTTAYDLKAADGSDVTDPFAQGAGHVDPTKFFDPGLVVTSDADDWLSFIKGRVGGFTGVRGGRQANGLNMPSIAHGQVTAGTTITRTFPGARAARGRSTSTVPGFDVTIGDRRWWRTPRPGQSDPVTFTFTRTDRAAG